MAKHRDELVSLSMPVYPCIFVEAVFGLASSFLFFSSALLKLRKQVIKCTHISQKYTGVMFTIVISESAIPRIIRLGTEDYHHIISFNIL